MAKAMFSAAAKADLQEKKALHLLSPLQSMCIQTDDETNHIPFAHVGTVSGSPAAYCYPVCGSYLAFYHIHTEEVIVDRILYGRRDYLPSLFGGELTEESE